MTLRQWCAFITACNLTDKWDELRDCTDGKGAEYVNLYQICDFFVKPWTAGTGNSVALLLNHMQPLIAEMMISHAWGECILETMMALLSKCIAIGASYDTPIWFCTFAQYQCGDMPGDPGPTVAEQIALDPFGRVIESKPRYGMLVVHTSKAELYGRLWCVFEVNVAESENVTPRAACSMAYMDAFRVADLRVQTSLATCFCEHDKEMITAKILERGGFEALDDAIYGFRTEAMKIMTDTSKKMQKWAREQAAHVRDPWQRMMMLVQGSSQFVGLHCLFTVVGKHGSSDELDAIAAKALKIINFLVQPEHALPHPPPGMDEAAMQLGPHAMQLMMKRMGAGGMPPMMGMMMPGVMMPGMMMPGMMMPGMGMPGMGMPGMGFPGMGMPGMGMPGMQGGSDSDLALSCVANLSEIGMVEQILRIVNGGKRH